jgi:hypothetical protein
VELLEGEIDPALLCLGFAVELANSGWPPPGVVRRPILATFLVGRRLSLSLQLVDAEGLGIVVSIAPKRTNMGGESTHIA